MNPIADPVPCEEIEKELTPEKLLRKTNKGGNLIYDVTATDSPHTMRELGRLRELSFRTSGGGTGQTLDIDEHDLAPDGYRQLLVWDPAAREIVGGYRYIVSRSSHPAHLSTEHYFRFSPLFREKYLPYMIELGRSFVQPKYQMRNTKSLYSLDNLWDGLGSLVLRNPDIRYFFGKVTIYDRYNEDALGLLIFFLKKYFADTENLLAPLYPVELNIDAEKMNRIFTGSSFEEDYKILVRQVKLHSETIPPLINAYMTLSPSMRVFDTVRNNDFGNVIEMAMMIDITNLTKKAERHFKILD